MAAPDEPPVIAVGGRVVRAEVPELCERMRVLLAGCDARHIVCDVGALTKPDAAAVDALARLQLTARRHGREIRIRDACEGLSELLGWMGLARVVPLYRGLPFEHGRQAEEREQAGGVEEEADPADPTA